MSAEQPDRPEPPPQRRSQPTGRAAAVEPPNRFEAVHRENDFQHLEHDDEWLATGRTVPTEFLADRSQSIICENDSPDVGFSFSINPYRGCEHGCAYCYARPTHEMLGMNAGLDFETKVLVKHDAAALLRQALNKRSWKGDVIAISGVTDCYQPAERNFRVTRSLLEVMLEARQPCGIITKNALVLRDLDVLSELARLRLIHVNLSITTLDAQLGRVMEPRTSSPEARLRTVRELSAAGVPVRIMVAPIVPGLTDQEVPAILKACQDAGATAASYVLLRLPWSVRPIFEDWLARVRPRDHDRVIGRIRSTRGGKMYDSQWRRRQVGQGEYAEQIGQTFKVFAKKYGLDGPLPDYDMSLFQPPQLTSGQMRLF